MKTKRRAAPFPSQPEKMNPNPPTINFVNPLSEGDVTYTMLTTKLVEPRSSWKKARFESGIIRRSQRIRKSVHPQRLIRNIEPPVIQILDPSGSEKDDQRNSEELFQEPDQNQPEIQDGDLGLQNQDLATNDVEHEDDPSEENSSEPEPEQPFQDNGKKTSTGYQNKSEKRYRTLYGQSQKKIEELNQANIELSKKLAVAEGKLEVFEKGSVIFSSILDKTKDAIMASALSRATEQALSHTTSPNNPRRKSSTPATKRKSAIRNLIT